MQMPLFLNIIRVVLIISECSYRYFPNDPDCLFDMILASFIANAVVFVVILGFLRADADVSTTSHVVPKANLASFECIYLAFCNRSSIFECRHHRFYLKASPLPPAPLDAGRLLDC